MRLNQKAREAISKKEGGEKPECDGGPSVSNGSMLELYWSSEKDSVNL